MSIEPSFFEKDPAERFTIEFDWTDNLPTGYTIASVTGSAIDEETKADATSDILQSTSGTVSGGVKSLLELKSGQTNGKRYRVKMTCTTSPTGTLVESVGVVIRQR